jgi:hypothetical protein
MAIIAVGSRFASSIISDSQFSVQRVYLVIEIILYRFHHLADIALLATIYCLLTVCFLRWNGLEWIHLPFLIILLGLVGGIMYTSIQTRIDAVKYRYFDRSTEKLVDAWAKITVAYSVLYLCAAIEVLIWAVTAFLPSGTPNTEVKNSIHFLSFIAIPLLTRSAFSTGIAARTLKHDVTNAAWFVYVLFTQVCLVLNYIGIVLIARQLEKTQEHHPDPSMEPPSGPPNGYAPYGIPWQPGSNGLHQGHNQPVKSSQALHQGHYPPVSPSQGLHQGHHQPVPPSPRTDFSGPTPPVTPSPPPQMQGLAYPGNVTTSNSGAVWLGQGH